MPLKISEQISKPDFKNFFHPDPILVRISDFQKQSGRIPTREPPHPFFKGKAEGTRLRDDRTSLAKPEIE